MIEVFDEKSERTVPLALFPADRQLAAGFGVQIRFKVARDAAPLEFYDKSNPVSQRNLVGVKRSDQYVESRLGTVLSQRRQISGTR
jgi:hypothetical protein